jgi:hypothetical protein
MPTVVWLAALAIALTSCTIETQYVPRTPHTMALGMKRGEAGIYKDGVFMKISNTPLALAACSTTAAAEIDRAAHEFGASQRNAVIAQVGWSLGILLPPLYGLGIFFGIRSANQRAQSYADVVDAINHHNDEPGCVSR